jgi:hypothetical protein
MQEAVQFLEPFSPKEHEYTTSTGRVFKFKELSAFEQMKADSMSDTVQGSMYYRMAASLISVDGQRVFALQKGFELRGTLERIRGSEADELVLAYVKAFTPSGEELKNESTPQHDDSSSN